MAYQMTGRHFQSAVPWRRYQSLNGKYIGIELEMSHRGGYQRLLNLLPEPRNRMHRPAVEADGSLNMLTSAEIVFPPFSYAGIRNKRSMLAKSMDALADGGANPDAACGMHINVNCGGWTIHKKRTFVALIHWMPADFIFKLGGRRPNGYCEQFRLRDLEELMDPGARGAVADRGSRLEVRFPKATLDHDRLVLLTYFIEYLEQMANDMSVTIKLNALLDEGINDHNDSEAVGRMIKDFFAKKKGKWAKKVLETLERGYQENTIAVVAPATEPRQRGFATFA